MGKHTPGPWHAFVDNREDRDGLIYVAGYNIESATTEVVGIEGIAAQDNAEANARLIAAAPELLEALLALRATCLAAINSGDWKVDGACDPDMDFKRANTAIAKATP